MANSADPDQLASKPTDLDLQCVPRQGMSCLAREGLNAFTVSAASRKREKKKKKKKKETYDLTSNQSFSAHARLLSDATYLVL